MKHAAGFVYADCKQSHWCGRSAVEVTWHTTLDVAGALTAFGCLGSFTWRRLVCFHMPQSALIRSAPFSATAYVEDMMFCYMVSKVQVWYGLTHS